MSHPDRHGIRVPLCAIVIGLWAMVPPYLVLFGKLEVRSLVEVVDHVLPGGLVVAVGVLGFVQLRAARPEPLLLLAAGGVITLAGFWMLATHVGLISQTRQGIVPGGAVVWHGLPGLAVTLLGVLWTVRFWDTDEPGR